MKLMLIVLASVVVATSADCDACIDGWCHTRKMLIQGFEVSDKMAIDRVNNILYVQITSTEESVFFGDNRMIQVVQAENVTAMTVDQSTQILYTTDTQNQLYKYEKGKIASKSDLTLPIEVKKILFHNGYLYYLTKFWQDNVLMYARIPLWYHTEDYSITDFAVDKNDNIYFVANDTVYVMNQFNFGRPKAVTWGFNNFVLSTDKFGDVYLGDATLNVIYKISSETNNLILYGAYQNGSLNEFIFNDNNNIVFHDSDKGTVNIWKSGTTRCRIGKLHAVPQIIEVPGHTWSDSSPA